MAVQWRTETSTGNLARCYERYVVPAIEQQRRWLGLGRNQVFFNTDLVGQASTTYNTSVSYLPYSSVSSTVLPLSASGEKGQSIFDYDNAPMQ